MGARLDGRAALVTGSSRGIGAAVALELARRGADVAITYHRSEDAARAVARDAGSGGGRAEVYGADLMRAGAGEALVARVLRDFPGIDILVHSAGIARTDGLVAEMDPRCINELMQIHVLAAAELCAALLPRMRERPRADIVMVSSVGALLAPPRCASYSIAKVALETLASTLAKEECRSGVRVNTIRPGVVATDMGDRFARKVKNLASARELGAQMPFGFVCEPQDIANTVAFLCSEDARAISGQCLVVDAAGALAD